MAYRAAVIGAGMIGARMDTPGAFPPQTHAGAYAAHDGFTLTGICDPQPPDGLSERWQCPVYTSVDALLAAGPLDIASVAVTPDHQPPILHTLAASKIKAVIAEKPLAPHQDEARDLVALFEGKNIPLIVNYSRRFVPFYSELRRSFGQTTVLSASIKYGKGLLHNGSHAIDILRFLFGEVLSAKALAARIDHVPDDPTYACFLTMERCPMVFLEPLDNRAFLHFEVDIVTDKGRCQINNDHRDAHMWTVMDNVGVPPGLRLVEKEIVKTGHEFAIMNLLDNAKAVLDGKAEPLCTGRDAERAQTIIDSIRRQAREDNIV